MWCRVLIYTKIIQTMSGSVYPTTITSLPTECSSTPQHVLHTNRLARVRLVRDAQLRHVSGQFGEQLFGRERHGGHVVHTVLQLLVGRRHELQQRTARPRVSLRAQMRMRFWNLRCTRNDDESHIPETIFDVHHGQPGVRLQIALVMTGLKGLVENGNRVVWFGRQKKIHAG